MKRVFFLLVMALLVIGISLNAQPQNGHGDKMLKLKDKMGCGNCMQAPNERMKADLNLTDEQVLKISDLRFKNENLELDAQSEIQKNRLAIRKMMVDNKIDTKELLKLTSTNSELKAKIKQSKIVLWLDIYKMLDEAQKTKWTKTFEMFGVKGGKFNHQGQHGFNGNECNIFRKRDCN